MAEIEIKKQHRKPGVKKMHKNSTRVDLTPMVDLGFLLLTFFVFTTTMSQPNALSIHIPHDTKSDSTFVCNSCVLTLIPAGNNQIYYYEGSAEYNPKVGVTTFSVDGIRKLMLEKKARVQELGDPKKQFALAIKPGDDSNYQNFVNILDEVAINDVGHYFIAGPNGYDKKLLPGLWK